MKFKKHQLDINQIQNFVEKKQRELFEPILKEEGLSEKEIREQKNIPDLKKSLDRINAYINPYNKPHCPTEVIRYDFDRKGIKIIERKTGTHFLEIDSYPLFLDRRVSILNRIEAIKNEPDSDEMLLSEPSAKYGNVSKMQSSEPSVEYGNVSEYEQAKKESQKEEELNREKIESQLLKAKVEEMEIKNYQLRYSKDEVAKWSGLGIMVICMFVFLYCLFCKLSIPEIFSSTFSVVFGFFFASQLQKK